MSQPVQRSVAIIFLIGFLFSCALALLAWSQYREFQSSIERTDHTYAVLARINDVNIALLNAETGQRGYLLTGRGSYLEPYRAGVSQVNQLVEDLNRLTADNPEQQQNLPRLRALCEAKLAMLAQTIAIRDSSGIQAVQDLMLQDRGKQLMDDIRQIAESMQQRERDLLAARQQRRAMSSQKAEYFAAVGLAAYLLVLLTAFIMIRRMLAARRATEEAAFRARELAEVTLHSIGDGVLITDTAGVVTDMNTAAESIAGVSRSSLRGTPIERALHFINRHTRKPIPNPVYAALGERRTVELEADAILIRADGKEVGVEDSAAPIRNQRGEVIGGVLVFRDVTERRALTDKLTNLALYDALTGLANRSLLEDRLQQAIEQASRRGDKVGLIYMDLDRFKEVNDALGHAAGDALLKEMAFRIQGCLRSSDTACRIGGDEFIVLLPGVGGAVVAQQVAEKIHNAALPPFQLAGQALLIRFSAGVAIYPDDAKDATELLRKADVQMYAAKARSRSN
jgi:diguanylate cyclase (GGDEF)-like protein/PAS domain S-box-containing protein